MTDPRLSLFLRTIGGLPLDAVRDRMKTLVELGNGTWMAPPPPDSTARPATHMYEIGLFGVFAHGMDELHAVDSWLRIARATETTEAA